MCNCYFWNIKRFLLALYHEVNTYGIIKIFIMMRKTLFTTVILLAIGGYAFPQHISLEFPKEMIQKNDYGCPSLQIKDDTLFVCCADGIYCKDLASDSDWEPYAFQGYSLQSFARHEDALIAVGLEEDKGSEVFILKTDGDRMHTENITPSSMHNAGGYNTPLRFTPNPANPMSLALITKNGLYSTCDFGESWDNMKKISSFYGGGIVYNPSDTTELLSYGENISREGVVMRYVNFSYRDMRVVLEGRDAMSDFVIIPHNTNLRLFSSDEIICRSDDGGKTWEYTPLKNNMIRKLLFDADDNVMYAVGYFGRCIIEGDEENYYYFNVIYESRDDGSSWLPIFDGGRCEEQPFIYDAVLDHGSIYQFSSHGVFKVIVNKEKASVRNMTTENHGSSDVIYDLMGRRLIPPPSHGIYIRGGRKYVR